MKPLKIKCVFIESYPSTSKKLLNTLRATWCWLLLFLSLCRIPAFLHSNTGVSCEVCKILYRRPLLAVSGLITIWFMTFCFLCIQKSDRKKIFSNSVDCRIYVFKINIFLKRNINRCRPVTIKSSGKRSRSVIIKIHEKIDQTLHKLSR